MLAGQMTVLQNLLAEYDLLGDTAFSSPHDFARRQHRLAEWAAKARDAIAELTRDGGALDGDPQPSLVGAPHELAPTEG